MTKHERKIKILQRYGGRCFYCRECLTEDSATLDHLIPKSRQKAVPYNLRPACITCNRAKGDMLFPEFRTAILRRAIFLLASFFRSDIYDYTNQKHS